MFKHGNINPQIVSAFGTEDSQLQATDVTVCLKGKRFTERSWVAQRIPGHDGATGLQTMAPETMSRNTLLETTLSQVDTDPESWITSNSGGPGMLQPDDVDGPSVYVLFSLVNKETALAL